MIKLTLKCVFVSLSILLCLSCDKEELDCNYDHLLEIMFFENGQNISNEFELDSLRLEYDFQLTLLKTIRINQNDSSLVLGFIKNCYNPPLPSAVPAEIGCYIRYGNSPAEIARFGLTVERDTIGETIDCNILSVYSDSSAYEVAFIQDKIILKILN